MAEVRKENIYKSASGGDISRKWWTAKPEKLYQSVWPLVTTIRQSNSARHNANIGYYNSYANQVNSRVASTRGITASYIGQNWGQSARLTYNVIKSCVDSSRAKIAKERPKPFFLTQDGNWSLQQRAKKLNSFLIGLFDQMGTGGLVRESLYQIGSDVFLDACISGTGAAKMFIRNNEVVCERFLSDELCVDQLEGIYGTPRSIHQVKYIDREVLLDLYPEAKYQAEIEAATAAVSGDSIVTQDMIPVIESFHLPSSDGAKDGCRSVIIETCTLDYSVWDKPYFPFLIQRWSQRPYGFFGIGLAEELAGIQREINHTLANIQIGLRRVAVPRVWCHISDHNPQKRLTNEIGEINYYKEVPPTVVTPQAFNAETYKHVDRLFDKAYEITGISQLSAASLKPAGLDSGVAIRNFQNIETERFSTQARMYEDWYIKQATYMALNLLDELLDSGFNTTVVMHDGMTQQAVKYSDVRIDPKDFTVQAYPTSFLPAEPSGKFAQVAEAVNSGMFDQDEARELLDFPDISKANQIKLAPRNAVIAYIEKMIETGDYYPIEPYQDIALTLVLAQSYYLEGRTKGMPEERLELLRRLMQEIKAKQEQAQAVMEQQMQQQQQQLIEMEAMAANAAAPPSPGGPEPTLQPMPPPMPEGEAPPIM